MGPRGDPIEFEFSSADASGSSPPSLTIRLQGAREAYSLGSDEWLHITDIAGVIAAGAGLVQIFADDDDGDDVDTHELMFALDQNMNHVCFHPPMVGAKGKVPKVTAAGAGQITLTGTGYVTKA